jgi:hypothetical protein
LRRHFLIALVALCATNVARAESVDLVLVLATDVSQSMAKGDYAIQKRGIVDALNDPAVHEAALRCAPRGVALAYTEWSGCHRGDCVQYDPAVPFRVVRGAEDFRAFARDVARHPRSFNDDTDIHYALRESKRLIDEAPFEADRRVIDLSSGGIQNANHTGQPEGAAALGDYGELLGQMRDEVIADDVVINALLIDDHKGAPVFKTMTNYYRRLIQGGPGAFTVVIDSVAEMHEGLRRKLTREICPEPIF